MNDTYIVAGIILALVGLIVWKKGKDDDGDHPAISTALSTISNHFKYHNLISRVHISVIKNLSVGESRVVGAAYDNTIFVDKDYVESASNRDVIGLLMHELGHLVMNHTTQNLNDERDATRWATIALEEMGL